MKRISLLMTDEIAAGVRDISRREDVPMSAVCRAALEKFVSTYVSTSYDEE